MSTNTYQICVDDEQVAKKSEGFKTPKTISLAEWLGREPTESEKIEVAALNQNSSDNEYFSKLMKMKAAQ